MTWTAVTEAEKYYQSYMKALQLNTGTRPTDHHLNKMLDLVQSERDLAFALRVWRVLVRKHVPISSDVMDKIVLRFIDAAKNYDGALEGMHIQLLPITSRR